jgi:hypothetical protein
MTLILPDFSSHRCLELASCGFVREEDAEKPREDLREPDKQLISKYTKSDKDVYMRLILPFPWEGKPGSKIHVHLVLATADRFTKKPPRTNCEPEEILAHLDPLIGKEINVHLTGKFRVPPDELPPFIRSSFVETTVNDIQVRMTGGTLSVKGTPIHTISWERRTGEGSVMVTLDARTDIRLQGKYLEAGLETLESAFRAIVVGEK